MNSEVPVVLFACVHNAGRSQMAAAWLRQLGSPRVRALSAGTQPGVRVHPEVVAAMNEVGIDLAQGTPRFLSEELARSASLLVTMGCEEACPVVPGLAREDWPLEDPKGKPIARVREIRDEIRARVVNLLERRGWSAPQGGASQFVVEAATASDVEAVSSLLQLAQLPTAGLGDQFPSAYALVRESSRVLGVAGLEVYGDVGLLRSVAVQPALRSRGLGRQLVEERLQRAAQQDLTAVYLLTTNAAGFFRNLAFTVAAREAVPAELAASPEFAFACAVSAACLVRKLR
jgi:arsenate reductase